MYGVLSADIKFIGLFICTLIISVVFHRLNETSPLQESQEQQIKDFTLEDRLFKGSPSSSLVRA